MGTEQELRKQVDQFILDEIDSVPQLEALLLIWNTRPKRWSIEEMGRSLYVKPDAAERILQDLANRSFVSVEQQSAAFYYESRSAERDELLSSVDRIYRQEIVRISTMIHAKASPAIRDFARAFRFTKDRDQ
ncbi:MAG TPA: hypothetical protein VKW78_05325 [Terriglobales bacterium]|nr:hypothetical protein [Terriglobales bacterium]